MYPSSQKGFTLVELLLYIGLAAMILIAVVEVTAVVLQARVKYQTVTEVEQQGKQILQIVSQIVRNANSITSPLAGQQGTSATIAVATPAKNPTTIALTGDQLFLTEGFGAPVALHADYLAVSNVQFKNISTAGSSGSVLIRFTLSRRNPANKNEFNYSRTFYGTATLR